MIYVRRWFLSSTEKENSVRSPMLSYLWAIRPSVDWRTPCFVSAASTPTRLSPAAASLHGDHNDHTRIFRMSRCSVLGAADYGVGAVCDAGVSDRVGNARTRGSRRDRRRSRWQYLFDRHSQPDGAAIEDLPRQ